MKRKILVPLDGSPFAERVLAFIRKIAKPRMTELILVHVSQPSQYYTVMVPDAMHTVNITDGQERAKQYLDRITADLQAEWYTVNSVMSEGDVASTICDVADAQDADLIAMTTHGRSGIEKWMLGSVADRVVRSAQQPVFLVRPQKDQTPATSIRRILVPLDGSRLAEEALLEASVLAKDNQSEIFLLQSVEFPEYWGEEYAGMHAMPSMISTEEQEAAAKDYLLQVGKRLTSEGFSAQIIVTTGHAASAISDVVADNDIDLIVMSTHGRSGLSRWVFGSVAEKVVRLAECPVMLIRAKETQTDEQGVSPTQAAPIPMP